MSTQDFGPEQALDALNAVSRTVGHIIERDEEGSLANDVLALHAVTMASGLPDHTVAEAMDGVVRSLIEKKDEEDRNAGHAVLKFGTEPYPMAEVRFIGLGGQLAYAVLETSYEHAAELVREALAAAPVPNARGR